MTFPLKLNRGHKVALFITLVLAGIAALSGALTAVLLSSAVAFAQDSAQAAVQAQKSSAQKLLMDSIEKLDVTGVRTALDQGADPNSISESDGFKSSAITISAYGGDYRKWVDVYNPDRTVAEILQMLFNAGARIQSCDQYILEVPVTRGWALVVETLLRNGADPTREIGGMTPMEIAAAEGQSNIVELLKNHGVAALAPHDAAQQRLIRASLSHDVSAVEKAIDAGAGVNERNRQGETALVNACVGLSHVGTPTTILYLLEKGADPTIRDKNGVAALDQVMFGAQSLREQEQSEENKNLKVIIAALLQHGALVSARDREGMTPLHVAAQSNNVVGAQMLIDAGCEMMPKDNKGKTPFDYAASPEMIKLLRDHGGSVGAFVPIPHEFTDRALMTNMKWTEETLFQGIISKWDAYMGEQGFKEKDVLRTAEMEISGIVFSVEAVRFKSDGVYQFIFSTRPGKSFPKDFREKFMGYAEKIWGAPSKDIDYSTETVDDSHDAEWDLGNTVISFSYYGAEVYGQWTPGLCLFQITQSGKYPPLKDLICLKCEGQRKFSGPEQGNGIESDGPFVILVDLNRNAILRRDKSVYGKIVQASQDYFVAEHQEKDLKDTLTIDRKLGTYTRRSSFPARPAWESNAWGKCEKTDLPTQPKF